MNELESKDQKLPLNVRAIPFYYLSSHAIELLLKCALLKRNIEPGNTHNLEKLLDNLISLKVPVTDEAIFLIKELGNQHRKHILRYSALLPDGDPVFTPEPSIILALMDELLLAGRISTYGL